MVMNRAQQPVVTPHAATAPGQPEIISVLSRIADALENIESRIDRLCDAGCDIARAVEDVAYKTGS